MPVTPSGSCATPLYLLRRMVALSATFQAATGAANAAEALTHVFLKEAEGTELRPCAVISTDGGAWHSVAGGQQNQLRSSGVLFMWLGLDVEVDLSLDDAVLTHANFHGGVADDIAALAGQDQTADAVVPGSHLLITGMHDIPPSEAPKEYWTPGKRLMWSAWLIRWGDGDT